MPKHLRVSHRFIQRLAEGVQRSRLVEPILAARPPLVVVNAPSGYGKTVLAAQIAATGVFQEVIWLNSVTERRSLVEAFGGLLCGLAGDGELRDMDTPEALWRGCLLELAAIHDDHPLLVVFDDASWPLDSAAVESLETVLSEAPLGSMMLLTSRRDIDSGTHRARPWNVSRRELLLSDAEIAECWQLLARAPIEEEQLRWLAASSGRHAALVSLISRRAALAGFGSMLDVDADVASLVNVLVDEQLKVPDRELLDYAAVIGAGDVALLATCSQQSEAGTALSRIGSVIPLVTSTGAGTQQRFIVHGLVQESRHSVDVLARGAGERLGRVVSTLAGNGLSAQALDLAQRGGRTDQIVSILVASGWDLASGPGCVAVRSALAALPPGVIAAEPSLLATKAAIDWRDGDTAAAVRTARLAIRLAETSHDNASVIRASLLLASMRASLGDYQGAISDLVPLLDEYAAVLTPDNFAEATYAAMAAHGFLGDRAGLDRCREQLARAGELSSLSDYRRASLDTCRGVLSGLLDGNWVGSVPMLMRASRYPSIRPQLRVMILGDLISAAIEVGDLELARRTRDEAAGLPGECRSEVDNALFSLACATLEVFEGGKATIRQVVEEAATQCDAIGERLPLTTTCTVGASVSVALRDFDYARSLSERGIVAAIATGSPILTWAAELAQAQACVAVGDIERGRSIAANVLPQVESIQAMGHVLHARMILAKAALHDEDLATAVQHLSLMTDHIVNKSPALTVACYLRAFPDMLGPLALAMGVDVVPARVLNLLTGHYATEALEQAGAVLTRSEVARLGRRIRAEADRVAAQEQAAAESPPVCNVRLFGGLEVIAPRGLVSDRDWGKRKARLLFAMLASRTGTDVPRGEVIEYLWPDMDEERALNNFYVVWSAMKRAISPESVRETPCPFVEHVHGVCRVVHGRVVSDLDRFADSLSLARTARTAGDSDAELAALRTVADLYRGEVLPGDVYDDWFAPLRERFRHDFEDAMLRAAQIFEGRGEPHEGLSMIRRATAYDPWREDLYQAALRMQIAAGQRSAAIETYFSCRNRLVEDLGIDPSRETTALYEQVLGMEDGLHP